MSLASISSSNHVAVYGSMTQDEKLSLAGRVGKTFGRAAWQALFRADPNIISGHDIAVILTNNTTAALTFYFEVRGGSYNVAMGCLAPTSASASGTFQLDGGEPRAWSTAPGYAVYPQEIPILSGVALDEGLHNIRVMCQQPVALLGMRVVDASNNTIVAELSAIQTFLYPNRKYIVPQPSANAEMIVPALNTRLYGPPLTTGPPYTGTPKPDLTCYETEEPQTEPPYIILRGGASAEEKAAAISQIGTYCARTQWQKLLTDVPGIIGPKDNVVILNSPTATLRFRFNAFRGNYNIIVRCVMPSANSDSGFVRLDSMPEEVFTRGFGPTKFATKQLNFLVYEKILLGNGAHEVVFTSREPMGYIELIVNRPGANLPDIVIPATNVVPALNQIASTATTPPPIMTLPIIVPFTSLLTGVNPSTYVLIRPEMTQAEKLNAVQPLINQPGKTQWTQLLTSSLEAPLEPVVIANNNNTVLSYTFYVAQGTYEIVLRYIAPGVNTDSCFSQIDNGARQTNLLTGNGAGTVMSHTLFTNLVLTEGSHTIRIYYREPAGLVDLTINGRVATLIPSSAGYGTMETAYPTTTLPPPVLTTTMAPVFTTTMAPTTTLAPVFTTTPPPMTTTLAPTLPIVVPFTSLLSGVNPRNYSVIEPGMTMEEKIAAAIDNLEYNSQKTQWSAVLTSYPNTPQEAMVILKGIITLSYTFYVPQGNYDIVVRYIAPGGNCDSLYSQVDNGTRQTNTLLRLDNNPEAVMTTFLFSNLPLTTGSHTIKISNREAAGLIDLMISTPELRTTLAPLPPPMTTTMAPPPPPMTTTLAPPPPPPMTTTLAPLPPPMTTTLAPPPPPPMTTLMPIIAPPPPVTMTPISAVATTMAPFVNMLAMEPTVEYTTVPPSNLFTASGSYNTFYSDGYTIVTFTGAGTIRFNAVMPVSTIMVAGGGGGSGGTVENIYINNIGQPILVKTGGNGGVGGANIMFSMWSDISSIAQVNVGAGGSGGRNSMSGSAGGNTTLSIDGVATATCYGGAGGRSKADKSSILNSSYYTIAAPYSSSVQAGNASPNTFFQGGQGGKGGVENTTTQATPGGNSATHTTKFIVPTAYISASYSGGGGGGDAVNGGAAGGNGVGGGKVSSLIGQTATRYGGGGGGGAAGQDGGAGAQGVVIFYFASIVPTTTMAPPPIVRYTTVPPVVSRHFFGRRLTKQDSSVVLYDSFSTTSSLLTFNAGVFTNTSGAEIKILLTHTTVFADMANGVNCRAYIQTDASCVPTNARVGEDSAMASYGTFNTILTGSFMIVIKPGGSFRIVASQNSGKAVNVAGSSVSGYVLPPQQTAVIKANNKNQAIPSSTTQLTTVLFNAGTPFNDQSDISYSSNGVYTNVSGVLKSYWIAYTGSWKANQTFASNRRLYIGGDASCVPANGRIGEVMSATLNGSSDTTLNGSGLIQMKSNAKLSIVAQQDSGKPCDLSTPAYCAVIPLTQRILIQSSNKQQNAANSASNVMNVATVVAFGATTANNQTTFAYSNGSFTNKSQSKATVCVSYNVCLAANQTSASNRRAFIKTDAKCAPPNTLVGEVLVGSARGSQPTTMCGTAVIQVSPGGSFQIQVAQNSSKPCVLINPCYCHLLILE